MFKKSIELNINNPSNYQWLGRIYMENKDFNKSEDYFKQAIKKANENLSKK